MTKSMKTTKTRSMKTTKTKTKIKPKPKTYLEKLKEETDKIFRRRDMKSSEELLQVFSASHSPHKQPRLVSSDDSASN